MSRAFWSVVVACACVPGVSRAQPPASAGNPGPAGPVTGGQYLGGQYLPPYPTGAPGPYIGGTGWYPPGSSGFGVYGFIVSPGFWPNGLSLYGPPVPVPGPIPGVFGNDDLSQRFQAVPFSGVGYGYAFGASTTLPRGRFAAPPRMPVVERLAPGPATPVAEPMKSGGSVTLSLRVPQPAADVFVNGRPTRLMSTDRTYQTPPLEAGRSYTFTITARWLDHGQEVEMTKTVTGTPGEVVRVDFAAPATTICR